MIYMYIWIPDRILYLRKETQFLQTDNIADTCGHERLCIERF